MPVKIYTAYDPPPQIGLECRDKSLARQSEAEGCDINLIMKRFEKTGQLPYIDSEGVFTDTTVMGDYQDVQNRIAAARAIFDQLPLTVRQRFNHDPAELLDFAADPANTKELQQLGLFPPDDKPPAVTPPTPEPPAPQVSPTGDKPAPSGA